MSIGLGIFLIVIGAILAFALEVSIPGIDDNLVGWILMIAGLACVILSLVVGRGRARVVSETRVGGAPVSRRTVDEVRRDDVI